VGNVRVFEYDSSSWVQMGFTIDGEAAEDESGRYVSLSATGYRLAIAAPFNDAGGNNAGHVRIYDYDLLALQWVQIGTDINGDETSIWSGIGVSLSADGNRVAVGAPKANSDTGEVRVWQLDYVPTSIPSATPSWQPTGQPTLVFGSGFRWVQILRVLHLMTGVALMSLYLPMAIALRSVLYTVVRLTQDKRVYLNMIHRLGPSLEMIFMAKGVMIKVLVQFRCHLEGQGWRSVLI
jgi:hypothetical protein